MHWNIIDIINRHTEKQSLYFAYYVVSVGITRIIVRFKRFQVYKSEVFTA